MRWRTGSSRRSNVAAGAEGKMGWRQLATIEDRGLKRAADHHGVSTAAFQNWRIAGWFQTRWATATRMQTARRRLAMPSDRAVVMTAVFQRTSASPGKEFSTGGAQNHARRNDHGVTRIRANGARSPDQKDAIDAPTTGHHQPQNHRSTWRSRTCGQKPATPVFSLFLTDSAVRIPGTKGCDALREGPVGDPSGNGGQAKIWRKVGNETRMGDRAGYTLADHSMPAGWLASADSCRSLKSSLRRH